MLGIYCVEKPFAGHKQGERLELTEDEAEALKDFVSEAEREEEEAELEEEREEEEDVQPQAAAITRAVSRLSKDLNKSVAKAAELAVSKVTKGNRANLPTVTPTLKGPVFKCMGEMLYHAWNAKSNSSNTSRKMLDAYAAEIRVKAPLGSNEGTANQGGYAVKPEWYKEIWDKVREYPLLLDKTERIGINSNTLNIPALSETSLADGSRHGGIRAYWVSEGGTATSSYPALTQVQAVLNTQIVLAYVTNQLLKDANIEAFDTFLARKVGLEFTWQENQSVVNGSGSGQPTGILNQAALITVNKSANDSAAMFGFRDLANMFKALYPPSRPNSVWLVNPEAYGVLTMMLFEPASGSVTTYPAFGGLTYNAHDEFPLRIFGRPVIEVMNNPQLGAAGDIILCDLSQLVCAEMPGLEADVSFEIQFTTYQTAFRFVRRYDIKSPWTAALTSVDGNYSYSPFVCLQARGT